MIQYKYNKLNLRNNYILKYKIIYILNLFFNKTFYSKPLINIDSKGNWLIILYLYNTNKSMNIIKLECQLSKIVKNKVKIKIIKIRNPLSNVNIAGQIIKYSLSKKSLKNIIKLKYGSEILGIELSLKGRDIRKNRVRALKYIKYKGTFNNNKLNYKSNIINNNGLLGIKLLINYNK